MNPIPPIRSQYFDNALTEYAYNILQYLTESPTIGDMPTYSYYIVIPKPVYASFVYSDGAAYNKNSPYSDNNTGNMTEIALKQEVTLFLTQLYSNGIKNIEVNITEGATNAYYVYITYQAVLPLDIDSVYLDIQIPLATTNTKYYFLDFSH